jgi:hypothetical protein
MSNLKWKDVAHYYVGCEIMTPEGKVTFDSYTYGDKRPIFSDSLEKDYLANQVKPILKRMEDIAIQDRLHVLEKLGCKERNDILYSFSPEAVHFLISKGYNVFGLAEDEFIDAKTQTNG